MSTKPVTQETTANKPKGYSKQQIEAFMQGGDTLTSDSAAKFDATAKFEQGKFFTEERTSSESFTKGKSTHIKQHYDYTFEELSALTPEQLEQMQKAFVYRKHDILSRRLQPGRSSVLVVNSRNSGTV